MSHQHKRQMRKDRLSCSGIKILSRKFLLNPISMSAQSYKEGANRLQKSVALTIKEQETVQITFFGIGTIFRQLFTKENLTISL